MIRSRCVWCGSFVRGDATACAQHADLEQQRRRELGTGQADDAARELRRLERELRRDGDRA